MRRTSYRMPEFVRTSWVSREAREKWEPPLEHVKSELHRAEVASVAERIRPGALIYCTPDGLVERTAGLEAAGSCFLSGAEREHRRTLPYRAAGSGASWDESQPWHYRGATRAG